MNIQITVVKAFTDNGAGGNPAGVVFNADQLSDTQKLHIAQAAGYPETAFVCKDEVADYAVSFFTPTSEVDFCGHATLATFSALYQKGILTAGCYMQRTKAGLLSVAIESNGRVVMEQQLPQKLGGFSSTQISDVIGLNADVLESTQLPIEVITTGLADVIIAVPNGYLDRIQPDDKMIAEFCKKHKVVGFHVFELCEPNSQFTASCRNFAPLFGISEEAATGSSSGALACYLTEHLALDTDYVFQQGRAMDCASVITASVKCHNEIIISVRVGGFASSATTLLILL